MTRQTLFVIVGICLLGISCSPVLPVRQNLAATPSTGAIVSRESGIADLDSLIARMTLEEKVGQLVMVRVNGVYVSTDNEEYERMIHFVTGRHVGGIVMIQGDVYEVAMVLNRLQSVARVPLLVSADLERGLAMRIRRTTYFGDAMAIGATRNPLFAYLAGRGTAEEARAIGIHQNYAPVADVNSNPDNPVINTRSFGDDLPLVRRMVGAFVRGTAEGGALATAKHFPGHGDTGVDSHLELPVLRFDRRRLDSLELVPFKAAIDSGAASIMVGHLAVPAIDGSDRVPASLSHAAIEGILRDSLGFKGLVITDAMDMRGVRGGSVARSVVSAINAGVDILLMTSDEDIALDALLNAARSGAISPRRLDLSVRRILEAKQSLGLFANARVDIDSIATRVATAKNLGLAKTIARNAVTVVRNNRAILPLKLLPRKRLVELIISDTDDNRTEIMRASNPFPNEPFGAYFTQQVQRRHRNTESVRLTPSSNDAALEAAALRLRSADAVIVTLYVKVRTSTGHINIPDNIKQWLVHDAGIEAPTVVVALGNPYLLGDFPQAAGLLTSYSDAEPYVDAAVEALFGEIATRGKLPVTIPGTAVMGEGITIASDRLRYDTPYAAGFDAAVLERLDDVVRAAIRDSAFPAAELGILRDGVLVYNKAFGSYTYDPASGEIDTSTMFDLASMTKVIATTAAVMKLCDRGQLSVDDPVSKYIPAFAKGEKAPITIRHLLLHRGGFPPFRQLWKFCPSPEAALDTIYATPLVARPGDTTIYSDLGMITVGKVVERITGMGLDAFVTKEFYEPLGMTSTMFNPPALLVPRIAPTEVDSAWRKTLVRGVVHDENSCFLGGVAGHAGLFSTTADLAVFMEMLLNGGTYGGVRYLRQETIDKFIHEKTAGQERWLGWDMRSPSGSSSGDYFSSASFGHTGFTGTSVWADPEKKLVVIFLTNRVYPTRANGKLGRVRPQVHNTVARAAITPL